MWGIANHSNLSWDECPYYESPENCRLLPESKCCRRTKKNGSLAVDFYKDCQFHFRNCVSAACQHESCQKTWSFEGLAVEKADEIAQRHHDIEDAIHGHLCTSIQVVKMLDDSFASVLNKSEIKLLKETKRHADNEHFIPWVSRFLVRVLESHLVDNVAKELKLLGIRKREEFDSEYNKSITADRAKQMFGYSPEFKQADKKLADFLKDQVLRSFAVQRMDGAGSYVIRKLFKAYLTNPQQLHDRTVWHVMRAYRQHRNEPAAVEYSSDLRTELQGRVHSSDEIFQQILARTICNHIACMTDEFAMGEFRQLYGHVPPANRMNATD
jgi:dGTPase